MDFIVVCCLQVLFLGSGQLNSFSPKPIDSHRHATKIVIFALLSTLTIMVNKFEEIAGAPSTFPCINNHPKIRSFCIRRKYKFSIRRDFWQNLGLGGCCSYFSKKQRKIIT